MDIAAPGYITFLKDYVSGFLSDYCGSAYDISIPPAHDVTPHEFIHFKAVCVTSTDLCCPNLDYLGPEQPDLSYRKSETHVKIQT